MEKLQVTKDAIRAAMMAAEEATTQDLRGMYPMACRTLATTVQVLRDNLAWAEEEVIRKVAERMSSNDGLSGGEPKAKPSRLNPQLDQNGGNDDADRTID